jgi:hypothetical protein
MNNALISPNELIYSYEGVFLGHRIAECSQVTFEVAPPLFWVECDDQINSCDWCYNTEVNEFVAIPLPPLPIENDDLQYNDIEVEILPSE